MRSFKAPRRPRRALPIRPAAGHDLHGRDGLLLPGHEVGPPGGEVIIFASHTPLVWSSGFLVGLPLSLLSGPLGPDRRVRQLWGCLCGALGLVACYAGWAEVLADYQLVQGRGWPYPDRLVEALTPFSERYLVVYYLGSVALVSATVAGIVLGALLRPTPREA